MSSAEENMALARRFLEARVKTDLDALDKLLAPDFVSHHKRLADQQPDREGYKWAISEYSNAGHDLPYLNRNGEAEELRARGMPLRLMPGMDMRRRRSFYKPVTAPFSTATGW